MTGRQRGSRTGRGRRGDQAASGGNPHCGLWKGKTKACTTRQAPHDTHVACGGWCESKLPAGEAGVECCDTLDASPIQHKAANSLLGGAQALIRIQEFGISGSVGKRLP